MGLFDKVFSQAPKTEPLNAQEAFAGIAVAMAGADGSIAESEWAGIVNYIRRLRLYENYSGPAFDKMFDKVFRILRNEGPAALVEASVKGLPEDLAHLFRLRCRHRTRRRCCGRRRKGNHQPACRSSRNLRADCSSDYRSAHHQKQSLIHTVQA